MARFLMGREPVAILASGSCQIDPAIEVLPGFYRADEDNLTAVVGHVWRCAREAACLGGTVGGNWSCKEGHEEALCGVRARLPVVPHALSTHLTPGLEARTELHACLAFDPRLHALTVMRRHSTVS